MKWHETASPSRKDTKDLAVKLARLLCILRRLYEALPSAARFVTRTSFCGCALAQKTSLPKA
jgi:hypothetical protein